MTPEQLRASILQFAVQGKLVEQRTEEGTAEELYQIIKTKAKELPSITEEEKSFDIPDSWKWIKLGDVLKISTGKRDANHGTKNGKYDFYTCSSEPIKADTYSFDGECLIAPGNGANVGLVIYHNGKFEAYQRTYVLERFSEESYMMYFKYAMEWNWKRYNADKMFGSATPYIKLGNLQNYCFPLPPLEEQHRIVAKIEELLPYVDRYAEAYEKLEQFNAKFPEDMKKSILQYAIQGKLVEQRTEEGTAEDLYRQIQEEKQKLIKAKKIKKTKTLENINLYEKPFDIPESWRWIKIGDLAKKVTDGEHKTPRRVSEYCGYYLLSARNVINGSIRLDDVDYVDEEEYDNISPRCNPQKGDILISCSGSVGRCASVKDDNKYVMVRSAAMISPLLIDCDYLMYAIQSDCVQKQIKERTKQAVQANLFQDAIINLVIPLPPLEEQHRIVAKIEELLPYCEQLTK